MNDESIQYQLNAHDTRLNNHDERIDKLEQDNASLKIEMKNLCENLK